MDALIAMFGLLWITTIPLLLLEEVLDRIEKRKKTDKNCPPK